MSSAKVRGNMVLPPPTIPKKVLESNVKSSPPSIEEVVEESNKKVYEKEVKVNVDEKHKGTITIYVFENKPYEAKFTGDITGVELNIAWRAMYKQYKLWKHKLLKEGGK